jgi:hypothetical protein
MRLAYRLLSPDERELVELTLGDGDVALQRRATINLRSAIHSDPCHWMAELQSALAFQLAQQRQESIRQERLAGKKDVQREEFVARLQAKVRQLSNRVSEHEHESGVKDRKLAASAREAERLRNMLEDAQVSETLSLSLSFSRARLLVAARLTPPHPPSPSSLSPSESSATWSASSKSRRRRWRRRAPWPPPPPPLPPR